jgi:Cathepsin propeptide inhibitor domain (I29)
VSGILPSAIRGDAEYDAHAVAHGRTHAHRGEYERRRAWYYASKGVVEAHNADPEQTYTLALNHLADWSHDEYRALSKVCSVAIAYLPFTCMQRNC